MGVINDGSGNVLKLNSDGSLFSPSGASGTQVQGVAAATTPVAGNPVRIGMSDGANVRDVLTASSQGDAGSGNAVISIGNFAFDGTNWPRLRTFPSNQDGLGVLQASQPSSTPGAAAPAAATAAVVTFAAPGAGISHRLTFLSFSVGAAAPAASIVATVTDGTTTYTFDVPAAIGITTIPLPPGGIKFAANAALTITLPSGAGTTLSRVNASKITA